MVGTPPPYFLCKRNKNSAALENVTMTMLQHNIIIIIKSLVSLAEKRALVMRNERLRQIE
jgi:hypothetical protein